MDSNAIIDYSSLRLSEKGSAFAEQIFSNDFIISVIIKIEVLGFGDIPEKMKAMEDFISDALLLPLDNSVIQKTIFLRRQYKKLRLGDAIIAATALVHELMLISHNLSDFKNIEGLKVLDFYDL